jgi:hypothetical protein
MKASSLPPNPDGLNSARAEWAQAAIIAFRKVTGTEEEEALSDLLCDLMHLANRQGENFYESLGRAINNYVEETRAPATAGDN